MPVGNQLPHGDTAQGGPLKRELGERHIRLMALGACIGVGLFLLAGLLALLLYNLLLFLSLRDRRFLLYSLYAATFSLGIFAGNGFGRVFLWPDSPRFDIQAQALFLSLAAVFSVGFACDFLQTRLQFPRLHGWLSASALGFAAVLLALLAQLALDFEISGLLQLNMFNAILMGVLVSVASALVWRGPWAGAATGACTGGDGGRWGSDMVGPLTGR